MDALFLCNKIDYTDAFMIKKNIVTNLINYCVDYAQYLIIKEKLYTYNRSINT